MNLIIKNNLILTLFIFSFNAANAQKTVYVGGTLIYSEAKWNGVSRHNVSRNIGKNVTLTFDDFFDSYKVDYTDINEYRKTMTFVWTGEFIDYRCNGIRYTSLGVFPGVGYVNFRNELHSYKIEGLKKK